MSTLARRPRKTVSDYLALPDELRAELVDGELYVTPSPSADHQRTLQNLFVELRRHVVARSVGEVFLAPLDVYLPTGDVVQPDILFVAAGQADIVRRSVHGVPDLLVEVVSTAHAERDRAVKRALYERNAVPEYWIVDPRERSVELLRHAGEGFEPAGFLQTEGTVRSRMFPDLALPLDDVFPKPR